jgi:hypothetical protein
VINSFRRCDYSLFDVLIALINLFDVVMVCMVFGVLFGFRRSDFRSSDHFPQIVRKITKMETDINHKKVVVYIILKNYSQTCANDHLQTTATCQQRPAQIRPSKN